MSSLISRVFGPFTVPVDYDASHREHVMAAQFDWFPYHDDKPTLEDPTEHLYSVPRGIHDQRLLLMWPDRQLLTEGVLSEMQRLKVRPAMSMETLAYARMKQAAHLPLVALGSIWVTSPHGRREVLYQSVDSDGQYVDLHWHDSEWCPYCCFAAVPLNGSSS